MNVRHTDHAKTEEPAPTLLVVTTADVLQITRERIVTKVGKAASKSVAGVRNSIAQIVKNIPRRSIMKFEIVAIIWHA